MDKDVRNELRDKFEVQIKGQFYKKPEFPFLPSMGCYHVVFPVREVWGPNDDVDDFGFLILEWECLSTNVWNWAGTWVDTEEELEHYKYKREPLQINHEVVARLFAERMAQAHHKNMMRQKEMEEDDMWNHLQRATPKPFLN